jgi:hypothetical protein
MMRAISRSDVTRRVADFKVEDCPLGGGEDDRQRLIGCGDGKMALTGGLTQRNAPYLKRRGRGLAGKKDSRAGDDGDDEDGNVNFLDAHGSNPHW